MNESFWEAVHPGSVLVVQRDGQKAYFLVAGCARYKGLTVYKMCVRSAIVPSGDALILGGQHDCDADQLTTYFDGPIVRVLNCGKGWPLVSTMINWLQGYVEDTAVAWRAQDAAEPREYTIPQLEKIVGHKIRIVGSE